ncbi:flagellar motor protein MotB [Chitinasiproducens palmae]|uniref:Chemotaxis protein MotB n=1 Tax=Chitinasiproducens palmae TaxID=1770053 RepID=A0A1H2PJX9_9BURK|nr:flagellar motor protein MotB [Chitinasiproducens palmae]SDV46646.1 chemotaxis protein MotB [Chitinasiproducens palmae]
MKQDAHRPIVIRRGNPRRRDTHGGSWKLAYADFMTAMMAFFLLMWLLGSVNPEAGRGIADYFKTPLKTALLGGAQTSEGSNVLPGGGADPTRRDGDRQRGDASRRTPATADDAAQLLRLKTRIEDSFAGKPSLKPFLSQIMLDVTDEGLRVQIVDSQNRPMFARASAEVEPYMRDILRELGDALNDVPNRIVVAGHTDAQTYAGGEKGYSNWELSTDRANASRRELVAGGLDDGKVLRVVGMAATSRFNDSDANDPRNRRISVIVLNRRVGSELAARRTASVDDARLDTAGPPSATSAPSGTQQP